MAAFTVEDPVRAQESRALVDPLLLCYDGSADARHAIERAGALFAGAPSLVLTIWQPVSDMGSHAWAGALGSLLNFVEDDRAGSEVGARIAAQGVSAARKAGLSSQPVAIEAAGPVWKTIVETADTRRVAVIVMGSRGLTGLRSVLLGSVSSAVVHHARRPTLVIPHG